MASFRRHAPKCALTRQSTRPPKAALWVPSAALRRRVISNVRPLVTVFRFLTLIGFLLVSSIALARDRMVEGFPDLPRDARAVAERTLNCIYLNGEFTGTGGERDREVTRALRKLRCDRVEEDMRKIRYKYRTSPAILKILSEAAYD